MFDKDFQIRGKHATYWKALSKTPGNAVETSKNFKVFENYIYVYMLAPIIGFVNGRKSKLDLSDDNKDTAGMLAEVQIKNQSKLKYIYRLIVLLDESEGLSQEERINRAFRVDENSEQALAGLAVFHSYFYGGLEVLYEYFVEQSITEDDYINRMYSYVKEYKNEQEIESVGIDINKLLEMK